MSQQLDWLAEGSFTRTVTHPPSAPRARKLDPETSHRAAERAVEFSGKHAAAIFGWLKDHPEGCTYREIAAGVKLEPVAVGRRLKELQETAGVYADGTRNRMTVWKVR